MSSSTLTNPVPLSRTIGTSEDMSESTVQSTSGIDTQGDREEVLDERGGE
jgi:hypothetical protein